MERIKIDESDLLDLLEDHGGFRTGYLDRQTGEILTVFADDGAFEQDDVMEKLEEDPDRYLVIEPIESWEGFRIMERFVESLPDGENRKLLGKVLSW